MLTSSALYLTFYKKRLGHKEHVKEDLWSSVLWKIFGQKNFETVSFKMLLG